MPLEDLEAYGRHSGSSGDGGSDAGNSGDEPKTPQYDTDANATEAESNEDRSEEQKFDGQSHSDQHKPAQKSKRQHFSPHAQSQVTVGGSDSDDNDRGLNQKSLITERSRKSYH